MLKYVRENLGLDRNGTPFTEATAENIMEVARDIHRMMLDEANDEFTHCPIMFNKITEEYVAYYSDASEMTDAVETKDTHEILEAHKSIESRQHHTLLCVITRHDVDSFEDIVKVITREIVLKELCSR